LNARIVLDDHALFRHPELGELRDESQETPTERLARRHCINYVRLGGHVGCVSNGAGLAMATMDLLRMRGIRAANFVDIGMGAQVEKVLAGLHLALDNSTQVVLVNIFGGVTRCDEIARGILAACDELTLNVPLVVRLEGTNKEAGYALMAKAGETHEEVQIHMAESLGDAVEQVALLLGMGERV
jgi:succinyl-CoA synthetase beta subunit